MTKEIIEKYGIDFQNKIDEYGRIDKFPGANQNSYITSLLFEWNADELDDSDHGLLADIDEALSNPKSEIENGSTPVLIVIYQNVVKFYPSWGDGEVATMPTTDLREIVAGWRDFLLTPPLNGTHVLLSPITICRLAITKLKGIFYKKH